MFGFVSPSYFATVVRARYRAGRVQQGRWRQKPVDLGGQAADSGFGLRCCRSGPRASDCTPFTIGAHHWSSSFRVPRMHLEHHGWSRPSAWQASKCSPRGLATPTGMRTNDEPSVPEPRFASPAVGMPNSKPAGRQPR
jgi:hypothetical protein